MSVVKPYVFALVVQALGTEEARAKFDAAGNSVKGHLATEFLSTRLGLNLFASQPAERA